MNRLHITEQQFWNMCPIEYYYAIEDFNKVEEERAKGLFEAVRFHAVRMWEMQGKELKKGTKVSNNLVPLPWDEDTQPKKQSVEEMKSTLMSWATVINKRNKKK